MQNVYLYVIKINGGFDERPSYITPEHDLREDRPCELGQEDVVGILDFLN